MPLLKIFFLKIFALFFLLFGSTLSARQGYGDFNSDCYGIIESSGETVQIFDGEILPIIDRAAGIFAFGNERIEVSDNSKYSILSNLSSEANHLCEYYGNTFTKTTDEGSTVITYDKINRAVQDITERANIISDLQSSTLRVIQSGDYLRILIANVPSFVYNTAQDDSNSNGAQLMRDLRNELETAKRENIELEFQFLSTQNELLECEEELYAAQQETNLPWLPIALAALLAAALLYIYSQKNEIHRLNDELAERKRGGRGGERVRPMDF